MIARVVVENAAYSFDIPFSYQVPQQMQPDIRPGCRVLAPFGKANRAKQGLVLALEEGGEQENLKPLKTLLDYQPLLDSEQLWLLELLHRRTFCCSSCSDCCNSCRFAFSPSEHITRTFTVRPLGTSARSAS